MTLYQRECDNIACLSATIQSGDMVTTRSGTYRAAGAPVNAYEHDRRKSPGRMNDPVFHSIWSHAWLVSLFKDVAWLPVHLYAVIAVHRAGKCVWAVDMEAEPKQLELWA